MTNLAHKIDYPAFEENTAALDSANDAGNTVRVGQLFIDARNNLNLSIKNVADKIHVRSLYLEAIEMGRFDKLPSPLYAAGFIKLYARFLELDGEEILRRIHFKYDEDFAADKMLPLTTSVEPSRFAYYVSGALMITCLGIIGSLFFYKDSSPKIDMDAALLEVPTPVSAPTIENDTVSGATNTTEPAIKVITLPNQDSTPAPAATEASNAPETAPSPTPVTPSSTPSPTDDSVTFHAHQDCWMEIDKNGVIVFSRILKAGETFVIEAPQSHRVSVGNAQGIEIRHHNEKARPLSDTNRVVKNISLETFLKG